MHVEFLGIPRERAGVAELDVDAGTLGQLLRELAARFPDLRELVPDGQLHPSVVANLNGDEFVSDPALKLRWLNDSTLEVQYPKNSRPVQEAEGAFGSCFTRKFHVIFSVAA